MSSSCHAASSTSSFARRRVPAFSLLAGLFLLLVACSGGDSGSDSETTSTTGGGPDATATKPSSQDEPSAASATADEPIRFETSDSVVIQGHLYSSGGPRRKVVVMAHELPYDQTAWTEFALELAGRGIDALTFDFRGYGETGGELDISKLDLDLEAAVRFINSRDYAQVYVFGASMGGTATLKVAADFDLAGIVTLSAPDEIRGLDAREDVSLIAAPKLFIAGQGDAGGAYVKLIDGFMETAPEPKQRLIFDSSEHGTDLLRGDSGAALKEELFAFLDQT